MFIRRIILKVDSKKNQWDNIIINFIWNTDGKSVFQARKQRCGQGIPIFAAPVHSAPCLLLFCWRKEESVKTTKNDNKSSLIRSIPAKKFELFRLPSTISNTALVLEDGRHTILSFFFFLRKGFIVVLNRHVLERYLLLLYTWVTFPKGDSLGAEFSISYHRLWYVSLWMLL